MDNYEKSRFTVAIPLENGAQKLVALHHTLSEAFLVLSEADWTELLKGGVQGGDAAMLEPFREQGILVKSGTDETAVWENWKGQYVYDSSAVKSKVIVTRRCNCRCRYCLIDKEARDMTSETARAMDQFYLGLIRERRPLRVVDEAGGAESTLNWRVLRESATRRYHFCQGLGIPYELSMVTNGTLIDRPMIESLAEVGLGAIRVSIAGPAAIHDDLRPFQGGAGTYEIIMRNLASVSGLVKIMVECQYDGASSNHEAIPEMMDDFARYGIAVDRIRFCPILPTRNGSPFHGGMEDIGSYLFLAREAQKRGYAQFDEMPSNRCAADFRYHYVFDTDGSIVPCPALQCGELAYGSVFKGVDFISESQLLRRRLPERCLNECELLPLCSGGCRQQALTVQNSFHGIDCQYDMLRLVLEEYIKEKAQAALASSGEADSAWN